MLFRRLAPLAAACALAVTLPGAAQAASVQLLPLEGSSNGIAVAPDGKVHVIEPFVNKDAIFAPDGTRVGTADLPAGAKNAAVGPDGKVWVATATGFARVDGNGAVTTVSTPLGCPPAGFAADGNAGLVYSAPDNGSCGTHGIGRLDSSGTSVRTDALPNAYDLAMGSGLLFAPLFEDDAVNRYAYFGALTQQASITVPAGSEPDGIVVGEDSKVYVTLYGSGQVARFDQSAANGSAATIVASGLGHPYGIAAGPLGDVTIASHDDGRLVRVGPPGIPHDTALPPGFHPQQVAISGTDIWATDDTAARVARVVDARATVQVGALAGLHLPLQIDPQGNDTNWTVTATRDGNVGFGVGSGVVPAGIGPNAVDVDLSGLAATASRVYGRAVGGDYQLMISVTNRWGAAPVAAAPKVHLDDLPATTPPTVLKPVATPPTSKPRAARLADLVSYAATKRCVATRTLKLTLRKLEAGQSKVVSLRVTVGKGKAKTYTAKQLKKAIKLSGLPKRGTVKVKVVATRADHTKVTQTLSYKICAPKKKAR